MYVYVLYRFEDSRRHSQVDMIGVFQSKEEAVSVMNVLFEKCCKTTTSMIGGIKEDFGTLEDDDLICKQVHNDSVWISYNAEKVAYM